MKKLLFVATAFIGLGTGAAMAADMPVKAPILKAAPAPVDSWSGFYIGVNAGGIWSRNHDTVAPDGCFLTNVACGGGVANNPLRSDTGRLNHGGFLGGGQIGINWQQNNMVYGLEADFDGSSLNSTDSVNRPVVAPLVGNFLHSVNERISALGTARARLGFLAGPSWLLYATGGAAFGHVSSTTNVSFTSTADAYLATATVNRLGWTAGAGTEWMFASGWSAKAEYLFVDLGNFSYLDACVTAVCAAFAPPPAYRTTLNLRENIVRVGINYHFGAAR
jgi:outer membrane immunogenic protein